MAAGPGDTPAYAGELRTPGGAATPGSITLGAATFDLAPGGAPPRTIAYRDLAVVAITGGAALLVIGEGAGAERWLLERFGAAAGPLVSQFRERRLRQRLADALVDLPASEPVELVEYGAPAVDAGLVAEKAASVEPGPGREWWAAPTGPRPAEALPAGWDHGVAQLALDGWGVTLEPLDERRPRRRVRRGDIGRVDLLPEVGGVDVAAATGGFRLLRLGAASARHQARLVELSAAAFRDMGALLARLAPDLPPAVAAAVVPALADGHPASPTQLGPAWEALERSVLVDPTFAASYLALRERAGGANALRWLAIAPEQPGVPEAYRSWFMVALPGNLVALELVSSGAHATYCFRSAPRAGIAPSTAPGAIDSAHAYTTVAAISAALVDARFLREPMALPDEQLATPKGIRYRLALRALPSLAAARAAFVARLVHRDEASWSAALDDLIRWHGACRDDAASWPGRAAQEAEVDDAADGPS